MRLYTTTLAIRHITIESKWMLISILCASLPVEFSNLHAILYIKMNVFLFISNGTIVAKLTVCNQPLPAHLA